MKIKHVLALILTVGLTSCISNDPMFRSYVASHRASNEAGKILNKKLITENPAISEDDKKTFLRWLQSEDQMIKAAEETLGVK